MTDEPLAEAGPVNPPVFVEPDSSCVLYFVTDYQRRTSEDILEEAARWYGGTAKPHAEDDPQ